MGLSPSLIREKPQLFTFLIFLSMAYFLRTIKIDKALFFLLYVIVYFIKGGFINAQDHITRP